MRPFLHLNIGTGCTKGPLHPGLTSAEKSSLHVCVCTCMHRASYLTELWDAKAGIISVVMVSILEEVRPAIELLLYSTCSPSKSTPSLVKLTGTGERACTQTYSYSTAWAFLHSSSSSPLGPCVSLLYEMGSVSVGLLPLPLSQRLYTRNARGYAHARFCLSKWWLATVARCG